MIDVAFWAPPAGATKRKSPGPDAARRRGFGLPWGGGAMGRDPAGGGRPAEGSPEVANVLRGAAGGVGVATTTPHARGGRRCTACPRRDAELGANLSSRRFAPRAGGRAARSD